MESSSLRNRTSVAAKINDEENELDCRLHRAAFHGNVSEVRELLEARVSETSAADKHGEISVMIHSSHWN